MNYYAIRVQTVRNNKTTSGYMNIRSIYMNLKLKKPVRIFQKLSEICK